MASLVFAAVLCAAAAHAGWNAVIKRGLDPFMATTAITLAGGVVGLAMFPFFGLPARAAWPWVTASVVVHFCYTVFLIEAYRAGEMGQVYPIARGTAPLMTAMVSTTLLNEPLGLVGWAGLLLLVSGVVLLALRGGNKLARLNRKAVVFALFSAVATCSYTLIDGLGARASGNASAYSLLLFVGLGVVMGAYAVARKGAGALTQMGAFWSTGAIGGVLQVGSYWTAIWAMTLAPIAVVAALRETSVLFGALIAIVVLKEPLRANRIAAAIMIVAGLALMRLQ